MWNTMWHNTIWAPCEKWDYLCGDCQLCVTVIISFPEQRRDSLTTWPAVIIYSIRQYLCVFGPRILFSFRWSRNEFGSGINKYGNDEKMSNPPANWNKEYIPPAVNPPPPSWKSWEDAFGEGGRSSQRRHAVGSLLLLSAARITPRWSKWCREYIFFLLPKNKGHPHIICQKESYFDHFIFFPGSVIVSIL